MELEPIRITRVTTKTDRKRFLTFPWKIYDGDPLWVPPLLPDLMDRTNPQKGVFFQRGDADFFIALHGDEPVGTICAAEDRIANSERGSKECVFGFFEFINDYKVFNALLEQVINWSLNRGLNALSGPFNLDYEDGYGVLIEGRDRPPTLMCGHSPAYYKSFYERFGFEPTRGDNVAFALDLLTPNQAVDDLAKMAVRVRERGRFTIRSVDLTRWEDEIDRIHVLLNTSLAHLPDHRPWPREVVYNNLAPFRKIADPELILFAEDNGKTIGWLPGLPNLNEVFIHANGLRYPWNYIPLLLRLKQHTKCLTVKSVLIPPEYWGTGAVILLFDEMIQRGKRKGYEWIDASLTSDDNPRTPALGERFGAKLYKRFRVYKKSI